MALAAIELTELKLHQKSRYLEMHFSNGENYQLSCEYLRVHSPSAEVKGHGPGQEVLQVGKREVNIIGIDPVGNYAVKLIFDDGHQSGIYTWSYLYELSVKQEEWWQAYCDRLEQAGQSRDAT